MFFWSCLWGGFLVKCFPSPFSFWSTLPFVYTCHVVSRHCSKRLAFLALHWESTGLSRGVGLPFGVSALGPTILHALAVALGTSPLHFCILLLRSALSLLWVTACPFIVHELEFCWHHMFLIFVGAEVAMMQLS